MNDRKITYRRLSAGQPGTKGMVQKYGEDLVCVRYRYDAEKKIKLKTVELIVDRGFWEKKADKEEKRIELRIGFNERNLREKVKESGGIWNPRKKVWEFDLKLARKLGLEERILKE